jgi:hypothetical protein
MGCSIDIQLKEQHHVRLEHPDKSPVAERSINLEHNFQLHSICILAVKTRYMDCVIREIEHHPDNMNREDGLWLTIPMSLVSFSQ